MTFQDRKGMAKPYQVKQLLVVIEKYRMVFFAPGARGVQVWGIWSLSA